MSMEGIVTIRTSTIMWVMLLCGITLLFIGCSGDQISLRGKPHPVIIFDIDTLRADALHCYGAEEATSPFIDEFAQQSILFEEAYAQAPNTPPSQSSIFTSLYPRVHGRIHGRDRLPDGVTTLAEILRDEGYRTAAFVDGGFMAPKSGLNQGFETYLSRPGGLKGLASNGPYVLDWIHAHARENFLLLVHTYDVHSPYHAIEPYQEMFTKALPAPSPGFEPESKFLKKIMLRCRRGERNLIADRDINYAHARYKGCVRYVDSWIGTFLETLGDLDLLDRSTIVLISDHGEEFQEHGSVLHEKLYRTITHIPFIIRQPGSTPGLRIRKVVESIDMMPTILELVGVQPPSFLQGRSLLPLINSGKIGVTWGNTSFGESPLFGGREYAIQDHFHLLRSLKTGEEELYDMSTDPMESVDLATGRPEDLRRMGKILDSWEASCASRKSFKPVDLELGEKEKEDLRALGYLDD